MISQLVSVSLHLFVPVFSFFFFPFPTPSYLFGVLMQWIAWTRRVPTTASAWTESATASRGGEGSTANCPGPSARTSATATAPSSQTPACAAATPTGWGPTAPWVSRSRRSSAERLKETSAPSEDWGVRVFRKPPTQSRRLEFFIFLFFFPAPRVLDY